MNVHRLRIVLVTSSLSLGVLPACSGEQDRTDFIEDEVEPKTISIAPSAGPPGTEVSIVGRSYAPFERVTLHVDGAMVVDARADAQGAFTARYVVPETLSEGDHPLEARDASGTPHATVYTQGVIPLLGTWTKITGGFSDIPLQIAFAPSLNSTMYISTLGTGMFKSTNTGSTWATINTGLTNLHGVSMAVSANNASSVHYSADKSQNPPLQPTHFWHTMNGGTSWAALTPSPDLTLFGVKVVSGTGIFSGSNNGTSAVALLGTSGATVWSSSTTTFGTGSGTITTISGNAATALYASVYGGGTKSGGVFKSTDGTGTTWTATNSGIATTSLKNVTVVAVAPSDSTRVYAAVEGQGTGVYKSTNSGSTWTLVNTGLTDKNVWALAVNPAAPDTVFAGTGTGIYKSTDGGASWTLSKSTTARVNAIAIDPGATSTIFAGLNASGELYETTTGG